MSEWQSIESAPKDGTEILAWSSYCSRPMIVKWYEHRKGHFDWYETTEETGVAIKYMSGFGIDYIEAPPLTVWMPIPPPPTDKERG